MIETTELGFPPYEGPHRSQCRSCTMRERWGEVQFACLPKGLSLCALVAHLEKTRWAGIAVPADRVRTAAPACGPHFDLQRRQLLLDAVVVRQYHREAENQFSVLRAFQAQGWPFRIENALGRQKRLGIRHRLSDTVANLNKHQKPKLIHFWVERGTQRVLWERTDEVCVRQSVSSRKKT